MDLISAEWAVELLLSPLLDAVWMEDVLLIAIELYYFFILFEFNKAYHTFSFLFLFEFDHIIFHQHSKNLFDSGRVRLESLEKTLVSWHIVIVILIA